MDLNKNNKEEKIKFNLSKSSDEENKDVHSNSDINEKLNKNSFNLSKNNPDDQKSTEKGDNHQVEKKGFNLSKTDQPIESINFGEKYSSEIKNQDSINEKETPKSNNKKKLWLWLLFSIGVIVILFFLVKEISLNPSDKRVSEDIANASDKANEVIAEVQNGNVNYDKAKAKVTEAQKVVDVAKAAAKTDEEKQAVADAQAKVDEAVKAVETSKQAAQPLETDKTVAPEESEGVTATKPDETSTPKDATNQNPNATTTKQGNQTPSKKPIASVSSQSNVPDGTIEEKARQVIRGDFGNGMDRKNALGSEYNVIQSKVNEIYLNKNVR